MGKLTQGQRRGMNRQERLQRETSWGEHPSEERDVEDYVRGEEDYLAELQAVNEGTQVRRQSKNTAPRVDLSEALFK